ncbi:MAG: GIY-YIG nuclease family protein [Gammaproteobacteria bacterium]
MTIYLKDIWPIENTDEFKIHFAKEAKEDNHAYQPLDVWLRDESEWKKWQEYRPNRNDFNLPYIFSLMDFYHEGKAETWLFGGVFKVLKRHNDRYEVERMELGARFIGRLKIKYSYKDRITRPFMENHYNKFEVKEILSEPYSGRSFPGFEDIDLSFEELEVLIENDRSDWKTALENVKGVYLVTDTKTNKGYVGVAYPELGGIWARWRCYIETGDGGNAAIHTLINRYGLEYGRKFFRFALLEHRPLNTPDKKILSREKYWKNILRTRGDAGLNRN